MDFALGFTSPVRRNSKVELPLPVYKSKAYDSSIPIHIPLESESSSMFETQGGCRITRWMYPNFGSSCSSMQKSTQFSKNGTALQKFMVPKESTIAISISQQTIVGGFVGSKSHAGRSMFGDSSQIWDGLICKIVELMSLVKEKPNSVGPKSKVPSSDNCVPEIDMDSNLNIIKERVCGSESGPCSISQKCVPHNHKVSAVVEPTNLVSQNSPVCAPTECKAVVPDSKETKFNSSMNILPPRRGTYSSVVGGTFKSENARSGSSTMVKLNKGDQLPEGCQTILPRAPQSYADVAKIIPSKPTARSSKSGCEIKQNFMNIWNARIKKNQNKINQDKKVVKRQGKQNKDLALDDIVSSGDTRWKGDLKAKRAKFQNSRPIALPANINCSSSSETSEENSLKDSFTKEIKTDSGSENKWTMDDREPICIEGLKIGLRGRYPSECSLDSEDSFVIFEECPDTSLASSSRLSLDHNSSFEECESEDDNSSSSDNSDYEDDEVDGEEHLLKFSCPSSSVSLNEDCNWINEYSAQSVPEKSKGMKKKKVRFAEGSHLAVIRPMIAWGYAYRESRRGPWEVYARDRARFHCRIASVAPLLNAILDPLHRKKVAASRLNNL